VANAVRSVLAQSYLPHEILIVDDGSADSTRNVITGMREDLSPDAPAIRYIYQANAGPASARNNGMAQATGDWIYFLDSDDTLRPTALAVMRTVVRDHPELEVIFGRARNIGPDGETDYINDPRLVAHLDNANTGPFKVSETLLAANVVPMGAVMIRREVLQEARGFNVRMKLAEDYDLWLRLAWRYRFGYTGAVLLNRHIHGGNLIGQKIAMNEAVLALLDDYAEPGHGGTGMVGRRISALHYDLGSAYLREMRWDRAWLHLQQVYHTKGKQRLVLALKRLLARSVGVMT
jgi:glycosyltransferase involved in cell wall biosynthesis